MTSVPTLVITAPPESPEQIPVVCVWVAVNAPAKSNLFEGRNGWSMELGNADELLVGVVRPYPKNVTNRPSLDHFETSSVVASRVILPPGKSLLKMMNAMSSA
jgi:hypothetical protein